MQDKIIDSSKVHTFQVLGSRCNQSKLGLCKDEEWINYEDSNGGTCVGCFTARSKGSEMEQIMSNPKNGPHLNDSHHENLKIYTV